MFMDASAIIAILTSEPEMSTLSQRISDATTRLLSPIVIYETTLGLQRKKQCELEQAQSMLDRFLMATRAEVMMIDAAIGVEAVKAHQRFGKGRHRARLNMGDCFAYACAKARGVPLLCKGDDFIHTDIAIA